MKLHRLIIVLLIVTFASAFSVLGQSTGSVKGKVRTKKGVAIPEVEIIARQDGKNLKSSRSNRKGEFRISGLTPGRYNLVFEKDGFSSGVLYNVLVKKEKVNNLKDRLIMTIDEGTLVIINGSVFNQYGRSVYGAKVIIEELKSENSVKNKGKLYSSQSGQFTFRFPEGKKRFRVTASAKGVSASKEIEVEEASVYRMAITLNLPEKGE